MYCSHCGTELPDDASYCYKCGRPTHETTDSGKEDIWEYCEITWERKPCKGLSFDSWVWFLADAVDLTGNYGAGESPKLRVWYAHEYGPRGEEARAAHSQLVEQLTRDGWEPIAERGEHWWQLRFRRKSKRKDAAVPTEEAAQWENCQISWRIAKDRLIGSSTAIFWADATGPNGKCIAGQSSEFRYEIGEPYFGAPETRAAHDRFVKALQQDGWELLPRRGLHWYELRFRRRLPD